MNRSQKHECGHWDHGRAVPFLGIFVFEFSVLCLCSVEHGWWVKHGAGEGTLLIVAHGL
jgi:hypothetical protein